ncbi:ImmA/IrrE family metallo-endopeptidase [Brevibacillus centrosporus]|uniref:ImmA/IrrE family metallo-endopeptidase n=1 Tax=Brevibacillus centrosporus TaxID=54910 RepID=UPI002E1E551F|nr:ImmA/IrrE family metallo-endopeptidase [Brevibacillus centrosporus]
MEAYNNYFDLAIQTANDLYQQFGKTDPMHHKATELIQALIEENNVYCDVREISVNSFCGMLMVDPDEITIVVNKCHPIVKRCFTLGHELGHLYLHKDTQAHFVDYNDDLSGESNGVLEKQANAFASELLLPKQVINAMLYYKFSYFRIAKMVGVSYEALKWRIHRYLSSKYRISQKKLLLIIQNYIDCSKEKRIEQAEIFALRNLCQFPYEITKHESNVVPFPSDQFHISSRASLDTFESFTNEAAAAVYKLDTIECKEKRIMTISTLLDTLDDLDNSTDPLFTCPCCDYYIDPDKEDADYCIKCGFPVKNLCSSHQTQGNNCGHTNRVNAIYCSKCGEGTVLLKYISKLGFNAPVHVFPDSEPQQQFDPFADPFAAVSKKPLNISDDDLPF